MVRAYYQLTKPGIIYGNLLPLIAAFVFASHWQFSAVLIFATIGGMSFVIASACVFNNYLDRAIDAKMQRTKDRALASGSVSPTHALLYATLLGISGFLLLYHFVNPLSSYLALTGFIVYVCLYTPLKPKTPWALFVGAVAGAIPPVVGYTAISNTLNPIAFWLFLFLFVWQIPHFLAIAVYRYDEYKSAGVPLFIKTPPTDSQKKLARKVFFYSLVVLLVCSLAIAASALINN